MRQGFKSPWGYFTLANINSPDWQKSRTKPYLHQISTDCVKTLVDNIEQFNKEDTKFKMQRQITTDEIDDEEFLEFVIEKFSEVIGYITKGNLNIRIH